LLRPEQNEQNHELTWS